MSGLMSAPRLGDPVLNRQAPRTPAPATGAAGSTLATMLADRMQRRHALLLCTIFAVATVLLLPLATTQMLSAPGFIAVSQTALILTFGLTTSLLFAQYRSTGVVALLILAAGSLYTTLVALIQLGCFPDMFGPGIVAGKGPATLTWLWTLWHLGPPLFALPYAVMAAGTRVRTTPPERVGFAIWATAAAVGAAAILTLLATTRYVDHLPVVTEAGGGYRSLTTSGVGPVLLGVTVAALGVLCWATRLRSVLQLWLAVSLFLLILDNVITSVGAARGTVGWFVGRSEALVAAFVVLGTYLHEISRLWNQALAETRVAQQNLEIALDASGMGDFDLDLATDTSRRTLRHDQFFGYSRLEPAWGWGRTMEHVVAEDKAAAAEAFERALNGGQLEIECRIRRADDGTERWIAIHGRTTLDAAGRPTAVAGCLLDVTGRRQTEARLREAERMEAVGQLTGGLAHDFNNLLTVIMGNLEMIARRPGDPARVERLATAAFAAGRRGAEMTDRLLSFSRRQLLSPQRVDVNGLLTELKPLIRHAVGEAIAVELDLDADLPAGFIDQSQTQAAILNLAGNARDAMPDGGRLTIRTRKVSLGPDDIRSITDGKSGDYLRLSVSDTGFGMDAACAARAFEPFFTTKDVGKGTGLGLSQVYGFLRQAGGFCALTTAPSRGCAVDLYLPMASGLAPAPVVLSPAVPLQHAKDGEVVLIVEDEEAVLEMAAENLRGLGYAVLCAPDARVALGILRSPQRIDILFSDVVMPGGMNGAQLASEARIVRPDLRVLLTSGYTATAAGGARALPDGVQLLRKPYLTQDLSEKLRM